MEEDQIYDFGLRIQELRKKKGWTQSDLAKRLGISKQAIYRYESNIRTPTLPIVINLAKKLDVSLDYLMGLDNAETIKIRGLDEKQRQVLRSFVDVFIEKE